MDTATTELNANDHRSVAEHLIMQSAEEPQEETSEEPVVEETMSDDQIDQPEEITEYEETEPEVLAEPERMYQVKVDGVMREVTEQELTQSYSGQKYIQQQMRQVAEQLKAVEQAKSEAQEQANAHAQALAQLNEMFDQNKLVPPDKSLRDTDPIAYLEQVEEFRSDKELRQQAAQQAAILAQKKAVQEQAERNQHVQQEAANLMNRIPILKDPVKGPELISGAMKTGMKYGFTENEMKHAIDTRQVEVLLALHRLEARGNVDTAEVKRGAIKPGAKKSVSTSSAKAAQAARSQMQRTGSTQDVAAWIMNTGK